MAEEVAVDAVAGAHVIVAEAAAGAVSRRRKVRVFRPRSRVES
jgi:hypothetical protein